MVEEKEAIGEGKIEMLLKQESTYKDKLQGIEIQKRKLKKMKLNKSKKNINRS